MTHDWGVLVGLIPLLRAFLAMVIIVRWLVSENRMRRLFFAYIFTVVIFTYISGLVFYDYEVLVNPKLHGFGNALWWAWMNVTTVGAEIFPVTAVGTLEHLNLSKQKDIAKEIYNENADEIKIRPYEHHAKYYETDQMGIIHHSNYIKWMEEARMDLMDQIGLSYKQMEDQEIISPVLSVQCEYKSMVRFGDTVVIETAIAGYNGIKLSVRYRMTDKETGELRTIAASEHCFLNRSGKPISLKRSYPESNGRPLP